MHRDYIVYLEDPVEAIRKIQKYTGGFDFDGFISDDMVIDAVLRNLAVIGEAVGKVPKELKEKYNFIEWRKIISLRNIVVHDYFGIDYEIVWDVITRKLSGLLNDIEMVIRKEKEKDDSIRS